MPRPPEADIYYEFFKAKYTTQYLENYIDIQTFAGQTLRDRVKLGIAVEAVSRNGEEWTVLTKTLSTGAEQTFSTSKIMVASGLTSIPNMPTFAGEFNGPIIHQYVPLKLEENHLKTSRKFLLMHPHDTSSDASSAKSY
jgi:L-lysine 6-monooxygenase/L-ornithine 5-monooxygenase